MPKAKTKPKKKATKKGVSSAKGVTKKSAAKKAAKTAAAPAQVGSARAHLSRKAKQVRLVLQAVLPCDLEKKLKGRKDEALLTAHLKAIDLHRQKYEARLKAARDKLAKGDASEAQAIPAHKAKVTEALGEHEATVMMITDYAKTKGFSDLSIVWTFTAGTGIDQLWWTGTTGDTYVIVEAKGPGATLSTNAAKGDQMSSQWVRNSLEQVVNSPSATKEDRKHARRMLGAMNNGPPPKVHGAVIEANPGGGSHEVMCPDKGIYHKTK